MSEASADNGWLAGVHDRRIHWRSWSPAGDQHWRAAVVLVHGYGEHIGRYEHVAGRLVAAGYAVFGLDQHGHGHSEGRRGRISLEDAVADTDRVVTLAGERAGAGAAVYMLGHSLGGAIALRYALAHQRRLAGMVLSGPLAALDGGRALAWVGKQLGAYLPGAPVARIDPERVSRDPEVVERYRRDPLVWHHPIPAASAREMLIHVATLPDAVGLITLPVLLLYGTADRLCPPRGSVMLADRLGSEDLTTKAYEGMYHELMNEPERDHVIDEVVGWLNERTPGSATPGSGTPSGAEPDAKR